MPRDRDIEEGYTQSWARQWPQRSNRLINENNAVVNRKVESGEYTPEQGQKWRDFNQAFYTKNRGDIYDTIDRRSGNFIDRRPSGLANLFSRMFGGGVEDEEVMSFNFPEAKEVVGARQYGTPITGTTTPDTLNKVMEEIMRFGEDAYLPTWAEESTALDKYAAARQGLYDDRYEPKIDEFGREREKTDYDFRTGLNRAKMDLVKQLVSEYTQSGEFDYPDPTMVYGYDDYMGSREMFPGYELGQGLDIGSLRPIQSLGAKPEVAELTQEQRDYMRNPYFSPGLDSAPTADELFNQVKEREDKGFFGFGAQEPTTRDEFDEYYDELTGNFYA